MFITADYATSFAYGDIVLLSTSRELVRHCAVVIIARYLRFCLNSLYFCCCGGSTVISFAFPHYSINCLFICLLCEMSM